MKNDNDNVIQFGPYSFLRQANPSQHPIRKCRHMNIELDDAGEIVRCLDCGEQVSAYWVFKSVLSQINSERIRLGAERKELEETKSRTIHLVAAKRIERLWRGRKMAPLCPHCNRGILPEDGMGSRAINLDVENRIRQVTRARDRQQTS